MEIGYQHNVAIPPQGKRRNHAHGRELPTSHQGPQELMYVPLENKALLVPSPGGSPNNPAWYYNLKADTSIVLQIGRTQRRIPVFVCTQA